MAEDRFSKEARELTKIAAMIHESVNAEYKRHGIEGPFTLMDALRESFGLCAQAEKWLDEDFDGHS